jgi:hypothetical protein
MIPPTRATYQRPDDRVPVGRATKPKGIGSKTSPQE